jgi:uncharacterized RDD family membrane protein YckC
MCRVRCFARPRQKEQHVSQPPGPNPYGGQPQQPYGYPQQQPPAYPQAGPYDQPAQPGGYPGFPQQSGYQQPYGQPYGGGAYPQPGGPLPGMPPLASWGARVGATLLDGLIVMLVPTGLLIAGYAQFVAKLVDNQNACDDAGLSTCPAPQMPGSALALIGIGALLSLAAGLYLCYREGKTGQTPGKKIVGIRLLREYDGSHLGFGLAFGRRLLHVLDSFCYIGYLWPLWDSKNQTFADKCVHTVVIKDQQ